jgi:hypothetical protein
LFGKYIKLTACPVFLLPAASRLRLFALLEATGRFCFPEFIEIIVTFIAEAKQEQQKNIRKNAFFKYRGSKEANICYDLKTEKS